MKSFCRRCLSVLLVSVMMVLLLGCEMAEDENKVTDIKAPTGEAATDLDHDAVIGPRVENEFLSPYKTFFGNVEQLESLRNPQEVVTWVRSNVTVLDDPLAWDIPMSPIGVFRSELATPRSRGIFFVALARARGFEAQKNPVNGKIQYRTDGDWLDVDFDGAGPAVAAPKGTLRLTYTPDKVVDNPKYYSHFSLSRIENGRPRLMEFDEGEVDMGGGMDWAHVFKKGYPLEEGRYLLVSGNRLSSGTVPVSMAFVDVVAGEETVCDLVLRASENEVPVIGSFDLRPGHSRAGQGAHEPRPPRPRGGQWETRGLGPSHRAPVLRRKGHAPPPGGDVRRPLRHPALDHRPGPGCGRIRKEGHREGHEGRPGERLRRAFPPPARHPRGFLQPRVLPVRRLHHRTR